jgi:hypothetical protein
LWRQPPKRQVAGDGVYPLIGGYAKDGRLVRVHIDFMVVFPEGGDTDG